MHKILTMTCANRPDYLKLVIDSISECEGINQYTFMPVIETFNSHVVDFMKSLENPGYMPWRGYEPLYLENDFNKACGLGCSRATYRALARAFRRADFVVHTEDDVLMGKDCLKYFEWAQDTYHDDPTIFTVSAYNTGLRPAWNSSVNNFRVMRRQRFTAGGSWGTWVNRWNPDMEKNWDFQERTGGFDFMLNHHVRGTRWEIYPVLSRVQNIGIEGFHAMGKEHYYNEVYCTEWSGNTEIGTGEFHE